MYGAATLKHSNVLDADNQVVISYEVSPDKTYADVQVGEGGVGRAGGGGGAACLSVHRA